MNGGGGGRVANQSRGNQVEVGKGAMQGAAGQTLCTKECKISRKWFEMADDKIHDRKATINSERM